jgi:hypothetical protein
MIVRYENDLSIDHRLADDDPVEGINDIRASGKV